MDKEKFEIKKEHLKLLQRFNVGFNDECEFGAPEIDPKRPYGNSSVYQDILEILGMKELKSGVFEFELFGEKWILKGEDKYNLYLDGADEERLIEQLDKLHKEMETVLQICLCTLSFEIGEYETEPYDYDGWKKVDKNGK